jgi:glycosyltransferase involved in cell wall biosynthesis
MIGIDLEQFVRDPQGSGIQRVLQFLAARWPDAAPAHFLMADPDRDGVLVQMDAPTAAAIVGIAFSGLPEEADLRAAVHAAIRETSSSRLSSTAITDVYSHWLLPEVSYLPSVLDRFEAAMGSMRTAMIGYDALPMTEPANYRFKPGSSACVSEYFRVLASADVVACISGYSRNVITQRLRRSTSLSTTVAHPGGDHVPIRQGNPPGRTRFCRVGTMEERKRPIEILEGFTAASEAGLDAELVFIGRRSASKDAINRQIEDAIARGYPIKWIEDASDHQVVDAVNHSSVFLSFGIEGYGIPVLEAIRVGTPVVYDGIQPAAELMHGRGAQHIESTTPHQMAALFLHAHEHLETVRGQLDPNSVPTWQDFTDGVVQSLLAL